MGTQRSTTIAVASLVAFISIVVLGFMLSNWTALGTSGLSVTPTTVRFPPTAPGSYSYQSVTITNSGTSPETFSGGNTPSAKFFSTQGHCSGPNYYTSIPAGSSCDYEFGYAPSNPGVQCGAGTISFESGAVLNLTFAVGPDKKGDMDCDGDVTVVDGLKVLRKVEGLDVSQGALFIPIGQGVQTSATSTPSILGDMNCDGEVSAVDALFIFLYVANLPVQLPEGCPAIGS